MQWEGPIMKKIPEEAIEILNELAEDANQWFVENSERKKTPGVHQVDTYNTLQAQIAMIIKDVKQLTLAQAQMTQSIMCDFCAGRNPTHECQHGSSCSNLLGTSKSSSVGIFDGCANSSVEHD
ncbi:hypothetical protein R3W88_001398 [Solanum pinnatisectum]|uniref:Uncharacterized protein n=1 Tax=Solanum pinnatisectum TaxID=50273 RepID=A0AAV9MIW2_9SOLN|nr:hypothetical protein R3W88_001398 [Solanum pinnatisectum]